jgi:hypothetical protein
LAVRKAGAIRNIEKERDFRIDLVYILAARAATARGLEDKFIFANADSVFDFNHGSAWILFLCCRRPSDRSAMQLIHSQPKSEPKI